MFLFACTTSTKPRSIELTFPHDDVDYARIQDLAKVAARAALYFVQIVIVDDKYETNGGSLIVNGASGIVIDDSGHIVTVAHIAMSTEYRAIVRTLAGRNFPASIIAVDRDQELALLRTLVPIPAPVFSRERGAPEEGQAVFAIGAPDNQPGTVTAGTVRRPRVEQRFRHGDYGFDNPMVLSMHVEPGYSGGPAFNGSGMLMGMVVGFDAPRLVDGDSMKSRTAYAIPASRLYEFLDELNR